MELRDYWSSALFLFPFGAGSRAVRLYVTVRVTTWRTLTGRAHALRGASKCRAPPSSAQSAGENGDRTLMGESVAGENNGDGGILSRRSDVGVVVRAERGRTNGEVGASAAFGDL